VTEKMQGTKQRKSGNGFAFRDAASYQLVWTLAVAVAVILSALYHFGLSERASTAEEGSVTTSDAFEANPLRAPGSIHSP
jgi:hypothetical protein